MWHMSFPPRQNLLGIVPWCGRLARKDSTAENSSRSVCYLILFGMCALHSQHCGAQIRQCKQAEKSLHSIFFCLKILSAPLSSFSQLEYSGVR